MRMKVKCGDPDCREEFYVDSLSPVWECPNCSREIINRNYPFLTAQLMQAKIDREQTNWKAMYKKLIGSARKHIEARNGQHLDISFLDQAEDLLNTEMDNERWEEEHDKLLQRARELILELER
ncbi:MAG: hypothetical protein R6V01_03375 [Thermoplasmatota archaeon]